MNLNELKRYVAKTLNETVVEKTFERLKNITERIGVESTLYEMIRKMDDFNVNKVLEQIETDYDLRKEESTEYDEPEMTQDGEGHQNNPVAGAAPGTTEFDVDLGEGNSQSELGGWEAPEEEKSGLVNSVKKWMEDPNNQDWYEKHPLNPKNKELSEDDSDWQMPENWGTYAVTVKHNKGRARFKTFSFDGENGAKQNIMNAERCPENAIIKVERV
jgi:hypothetical protein